MNRFYLMFLCILMYPVLVYAQDGALASVEMNPQETGILALVTSIALGWLRKQSWFKRVVRDGDLPKAAMAVGALLTVAYHIYVLKDTTWATASNVLLMGGVNGALATWGHQTVTQHGRAKAAGSTPTSK